MQAQTVMARRIALFTALFGFLSLDCKTTDPADTDGSTGGSTSSGLTTTSTTTLTTLTTVDPTSSGSSSTGPGTTDVGSSGSVSDTASGTTDMTTGPVGPCVPIACPDGKTWACGDCMDNDGDGLVDLADPECISPCDDREDNFSTGLPGDNMDPCKQDCFFDGNSGGGKGDCAWDLGCDPMNPGGDSCPYNPDKVCSDTQSMECTETCNTPSGCDCFGCCTVTVDGMSYDIFLGSDDCSVDNSAGCQMCSKNDDCDDPCMPELCELCFGETELPDGCDMPTCEGLDPCTIDKEGMSNCPEGTYCQTGCCQLLIPG